MIDLEVLYSARSPAHYQAMLAERQTQFTDLPITVETCNRAIAVQSELAARSQHRGCRAPDLLIAACAELYEIPILHYDSDFDRIATVTGQPTTWIVPRGSVS